MTKKIYKELKKKMRRISCKLNKKQELYKISKFASTLALFAILLVFISSLNLEMRFPRRQVARQTNAVLQLGGMDTQFYENSVIIPMNSPILPEATERLTDLGMKEREIEGARQFLSESMRPNDEKILNYYTNNLKKQGHRIYTTPSLIDVNKRAEPFQIDVVPECVGWIGMFAIIALILAYPDAKKREKFLGIVMALPLIHLMNLVRLSTTIYAGWNYGIKFLDFVHDFLWRTLLIFWALLLWLIWIKYIVNEEDEKEK
ncbi:MAG: exosortase/archaeosortase family protein [archaeon]